MIVDIINKKRLGNELSLQELQDTFNGYLIGEVKDYQMSALLMAICIKGMTEREIFDLTDIFIDSGEVITQSDSNVDKHSTGGVGDKTTLIISPIVASLGVPVLKMSGRGLGHTGGTIDKLESIPGFRTILNNEDIKKQIKKIGIVVASQTNNLAPLDKKIYALRDVTGTVESLPLIAVSIMSKKIASGAENILIDVKVGKGALVKTVENAKILSQLMVKIGAHYNRTVQVIISNMDVPLGDSIGNALEVEESIRVLKNESNNYLSSLSINLASNMVAMGKNISLEEATIQVEEVLRNGKAYAKFLEFVRFQGGDINKLKISDKTKSVYAPKSGVIKNIDALEMGKLSVSLGAGREQKEDAIDHSVGIVIHKNIGETVEVGDVLCTIYMNKETNVEEISNYFEIEEKVL